MEYVYHMYMMYYMYIYINVKPGFFFKKKNFWRVGSVKPAKALRDAKQLKPRKKMCQKIQMWLDGYGSNSQTWSTPRWC